MKQAMAPPFVSPGGLQALGRSSVPLKSWSTFLGTSLWRVSVSSSALNVRSRSIMEDERSQVGRDCLLFSSSSTLLGYQEEAGEFR